MVFVVSRLRAIVIGLGVAGAYALTGWASVNYALVSSITPIWPPIGIAVVAIVLAGRRAIVPVFAGGLLFEFLSPGFSALDVVKVAGTTLAPALIALGLLQRGFSPRLGRLRDGLLLIGIGAAGALVSAGIGTATLFAGSVISRQEALTTFSVWWTGDTMGVIIVSPVLFALMSWPRGHGSARNARLSILVLLIAIGSVATFAIVTSGAALLFALVPAVVLAAIIGEVWGASVTALAISVSAVLASSNGEGTFAGGTLLEQMAKMQAFNATIAITALLFAGLTTERRRSWNRLQVFNLDLEALAERRASALRASERRLEEAQAAGDVACWEASLTRGTVWGSGAIAMLMHVPLSDAPMTFGDALTLVHSDDHESLAQDFREAIEQQSTVDREIRIIGADGAVRWFALRGKALQNEDGTVRLAGTITDIAVRHRAAQDERRLVESEIKRRQALEINDEIVSHLTTAQYLLRKGQTDEGLRLVDKARDSARVMVSDLIHPVRDGGFSLDVGDILVSNAVLNLRSDLTGRRSDSG